MQERSCARLRFLIAERADGAQYQPGTEQDNEDNHSMVASSESSKLFAKIDLHDIDSDVRAIDQVQAVVEDRWPSSVSPL